MFSGIIERLGTIQNVALSDGSITLAIGTRFGDLTLGESVAVNGVCLTVVTYYAQSITSFYTSPETFQRSNLGRLRVGDRANLERAVSLSTRLSSHIVQGHVDGLAMLDAIRAEADAYLIELTLPKSIARYCLEKGSITLDGISLTLNRVQDMPSGDCRVGLTIIPHTWAHTNLQTRAHGDLVNVEFDVLAKHVERLCKPSH